MIIQCWQIAAICLGIKAATAIHTYGLNFTLKLWAESLVLYACPLLNYNVQFVLFVSRLPLSVIVRSCHVSITSSLLRVSFMQTLSSGSSPSLTGGGHKTIRGCSLSLRGISKCACFKFSMAARNQASKKASKKTYTHTCAMQSC